MACYAAATFSPQHQVPCEPLETFVGLIAHVTDMPFACFVICTIQNMCPSTEAQALGKVDLGEGAERGTERAGSPERLASSIVMC